MSLSARGGPSTFHTSNQSVASHHTETCNVVIFGETGAGKSSLINLITGTKTALTSCDAVGCTTKYQGYDVLIQNETLKLKLFDTPGLEECSEGAVPDKEARHLLKTLLRDLRNVVHLLMYCVRGASSMRTLSRNYKFIHSQVKVPIVLVVTGLEGQQPDMEEWWKNNAHFVSASGMIFAGHACVTTIDEGTEEGLKERRKQSYHAVCQLIERCRLSKGVQPPPLYGASNNIIPKIETTNEPSNVPDTTRPVGPPKRQKIILLFGDTGAGKSSLVNLMAGKEIASTSSDMQRCTMQWKEYTIGFDEESYKVFDTSGLDDPQLGIKEYLATVENAYRLIKKLEKQNGIGLLLFCVRAGTITATFQSNYRLFYEFFCEKKVPIVLAITNLEREKRMEDWWERNEDTLKRYQIQVAGHACITAANRLDGRHQELYEQSRITIRKLVKEYTANGQQAWIGGDSLFVSLTRNLKVFFIGSSHVKRKDLILHLMDRCGMSREVATRLADMMM